MITVLMIAERLCVLALTLLGIAIIAERFKRSLIIKLIIGVAIAYIMLTSSNIIINSNAREADKIAAQQEREADQARFSAESEEREARYYFKVAELIDCAPKELVRATLPPVSGQVEILSPIDGGRVSDRIIVKGRLSGIGGKVWLVVHPVGIASYWVQPQINLKSDGRWSARAYIGRAGMDIDQAFEIIAVVDPVENLIEGDVLDSWPEARWSSQVIEVVRK